MKQPQEKIKSLTGVKNAVLKHRKVWLTIDGKNWVYAEIRAGNILWINFGLNDEETTDFHLGLTDIFDFLSFKRSTDLL